MIERDDALELLLEPAPSSGLSPAWFIRRMSQKGMPKPRLAWFSARAGDWITLDSLARPERLLGQAGAASLRTAIPKTLKSFSGVVLDLGPGAAPESLGEIGPVVQSPSAAAEIWTAIGRLWVHGAAVDWSALHAGHDHYRLALPGYPFERERHWIEPDRKRDRARSVPAPVSGRTALEMMEEQLETISAQLAALGARAGDRE